MLLASPLSVGHGSIDLSIGANVEPTHWQDKKQRLYNFISEKLTNFIDIEFSDKIYRKINKTTEI